MNGLSKKNIGIYFLGNDAVLDQAIAMLESLRYHNPETLLTLIPFDENVEKLSALGKRFRFDVWRDDSLKELTEIGREFFPDSLIAPNTFRKFSVFWGKYEHFMFLDTDIVLINSLSQLFESYFGSDAQFVYSDPFIGQAYKEGDFQRKMQKEYDSKGFCTGSFIASNKIFPKRELFALIHRCFEAQEYFAEWRTYEQPHLNYCIDVAKIKKRSVSELLPDVSDHNYAIHLTYRKIRNQFQLISVKNSDRTSSEDKKKRLWIHWASVGVGALMPNRSLFLHYRLLNEPLLKKIWYLMKFYAQMRGKGLKGKIVNFFSRLPELTLKRYFAR